MRQANNPKLEEGVHSQAMSGIAIISLADKKVMYDLTDDVFSGGNNFVGLRLLWSADSKLCACSFLRARDGSTNVFHLNGEKFELAHPWNELSAPTKDNLRSETIVPVRWKKPGALELSVERDLREDAKGDGLTGFTASFDGKGKFKIISRKH